MRTRGLKRLATIADVRAAARARLPRMVFDYVDGGAGDEVTLQANASAFRRLTFHPRVLVDVGERRLETSVCGQRLSFPVVLAPTGLPGLVAPAAEVEAARAARAAGTVLTLSAAGSRSVSEVAAAVGAGWWFQLVPWRDRAVTQALLDGARTGGAGLLVVTVDMAVFAERPRDVRHGLTLPLRPSLRTVLGTAARPAWVLAQLREPAPFLGSLTETGLVGAGDPVALVRHLKERLIDPSATWAELGWIRARWDGPLLVKGVLTVEDARRAVGQGANGVVVSNHGGRQLDGVPASLDALWPIAEAFGSDVDILVDGGVRSGRDVAKALARGARACLVGRPWLYGLAVAGEAGVAHVLHLLRDDLDRTLALLGCRSVEELGPDALAAAARPPAAVP